MTKLRLPLLALSVLLGGLLYGSPLRADVADRSEVGFTIRVVVPVQSDPQACYDAMLKVQDWWSSSHTYSNDARNLYLEAEPKGWFGERFPDGGCVQHMEVLAVLPGKYVRLRGALGPLQEFALTGVMTWKFVPVDDTTRLELTYYVGGYRPGGVSAFANAVDSVITEQVQRLKSYIETGKPE